MAGEFNIALIDPSADEIYTALGVSEERSDEIVEIVRESYKSDKYFSETLANITSQMNHINEVVFATLIAARIHDAKKHHDLHEKIKSMEVIIELLKFKIK